MKNDSDLYGGLRAVSRECECVANCDAHGAPGFAGKR
jgi:hypothetical protein